MSQENVELVRRGIESVEAFWALLDEDVVWDLGRDPPPDIHGVYVGRDSVIEASRRYWGTWECIQPGCRRVDRRGIECRCRRP